MRGDVKGYFVGDEHVNSYVGNYYGVQLGYAPGTGFGAVYRNTSLVFAKDFNIDLTANPQITAPPLPIMQTKPAKPGKK